MSGPGQATFHGGQNGWAYQGMVKTMEAMHKDPTPWQREFARVWDPRTPAPPGSRY
ncbi:MAG TPA: hypothetical protein VEX86_05625 [Longimicrobium sp.]|nr:hypothetical protein [Longimicrobium sp.]